MNMHTLQILNGYKSFTSCSSHLNELNWKLQVEGNTALMLLEEVLSFERKLSLLEMLREAL